METSPYMLEGAWSFVCDDFFIFFRSSFYWAHIPGMMFDVILCFVDGYLFSVGVKVKSVKKNVILFQVDYEVYM